MTGFDYVLCPRPDVPGELAAGAPVPGSTAAACAICGCEVVVGPKARAVAPGVRPICPPCAEQLSPPDENS